MSWWSIAEQALGILIFLFVLLDVFMTVLYARLGSKGLARWGAGVIGNVVGRTVSAVLERVPARRKWRNYTSETGDAAELVCALAPQGDFSLAIANLGAMGKGMTAIEEAHHFHPLLFHFRTATEERSLIRVLLVSLDAVSLMRTALSENERRRIGESAPVIQLWRASLITARMLESTFLGVADAPTYRAPEDAKVKWRERFRKAHERMSRSGIPVCEDVEAGAAAYVGLRECWQKRIEVLTAHVHFPYEAMDPASTTRR